MEHEVRQIMDLQADVKNQLIFRNSTEITLPGLTQKLFFTLLRKAPEPISMAELARDVWEEDYVSEETIAQRVSLLRRALKAPGGDLNYIQAVRGKGYRLNLTLPVLPNDGAGHQKNIGPASLWGVLATLLIVGTGLYLYQLNGPEIAQAAPPVAGVTLTVSDLIPQARKYQVGHRLEDIDRAISLYEKALELDGTSIDAQIGLSFALSTKATKFSMASANIEEAERLARAVLKDNNKNSRAWHALAYALDGQGQVDKAISFYLRAVELNPKDHNARSSAAYLLSIKGRFYEALLMEAELVTTGHSTLYSEIQIAFSLDQLGFPADAQNWMDKALILHPGHPVVRAFNISLKLRQGDFPQAEQLYLHYSAKLQKTPKIKSLRAEMTIAQSSYAELELALEQRNALRQELDIFLPNIKAAVMGDKGGNLWPESHVNMAYYHVLNGKKKLALGALRMAVDMGWRDAETTQNYPFFEKIKEDVEFKNIVARIKEEIGSQKELLFSNEDLIRKLGITFKS